MNVSTRDRAATPTTALRACMLGLAGLVVLKFLVILADQDWDFARAPFGPLVLVGVSVALVVALSTRRPRAAAGVALPLLVLFLAVVGSALARDGLARESWADYPFVYGGAVLAVIGAVEALRILRRR